MRFFGGGSCKQNMLSPSEELIFERGREERVERGREGGRREEKTKQTE